MHTDLKLMGTVVTGFSRGSKQLGVPTANIEMTSENIEKSNGFVPGVYMGYASIDGGEVYKAAVSIGWNPVYDNKQKTVEAYLLTDGK